MSNNEKRQMLSVRLTPDLLQQIEQRRAEAERQSGYKPSTTQVVERLLNTALERR
ncbi:TPA: hypothetical protein QA377_004328 [Raoultella ornithinolytica]|nr:hypothetical protein [Raoultella ornithinolytica]